MHYFRLWSLLVLTLSASQLRAEDPTDKNFPGPYAGGQMILGQAAKVGNGAPGPAYLLSFDLGYGLKRDTWNRLEFGLELGTGKASLTDGQSTGDFKVDVNLQSVMMIKAGYGYSLGSSSFGVFRLGLGVAQASYQGAKGINGGNASGVATMIGWDAVYPASPTVDVLFGASLRILNFNFADLPSNNRMQMNLPALSGGMRFRF